MFFEDDRDEKEVENGVKEEKGATDEQASLRDGFVSLEAESSLEEFEDPEIDTGGEYDE